MCALPSGPDPGGARPAAADPDPKADPESVARALALRRLNAQPRTRAELEQTLAQRSVPPEVAAGVLDRLEQVGLVDDAAFARDWVQSRQAGRGLARRALAVELRRKGVDQEVITAAVATVDPDDEVESARDLVRRKVRSLERFDRQTQVRRLTGMLARKGYPAGTAFRVVREALAAEGEDAGLGFDELAALDDEAPAGE